LSRHRSLLLGGSGITATAASTTTTTAIAGAAAMMTAMATAVATMATVAAIATVAAAALVMTEGHRLAVTTDQSDANDREEHRETQNNNTIHPQILQITYRYRK
jgi:hypothetical protein